MLLTWVIYQGDAFQRVSAAGRQSNLSIREPISRPCDSVALKKWTPASSPIDFNLLLLPKIVFYLHEDSKRDWLFAFEEKSYFNTVSKFGEPIIVILQFDLKFKSDIGGPSHSQEYLFIPLINHSKTGPRPSSYASQREVHFLLYNFNLRRRKSHNKINRSVQLALFQVNLKTEHQLFQLSLSIFLICSD